MEKITYEEFVDGLRAYIRGQRKDSGLTQNEMGDKVGKPQSTVARFESGNVKDPHLSYIFEICEGLGIRPGDALNAVFEKHGQGLLTKKQLESRIEEFQQKVAELSDDEKEVVVAILDSVGKLI